MKRIIVEALTAKLNSPKESVDYSNLHLGKRILSSSSVGIWWLIKGEVLQYEDLVENLKFEDQICVEQEHRRVWPLIQEKYSSKFPELLSLKYNQVERGRVWFLSKEKRYLITASTEISHNQAAISKIKRAFNLPQNTQTQTHASLYDREIKINPM